MQRRVLYFLLQELHKYPPCIAEICMLKDNGIDVVVLTTGCAGPTAKLLEEKGIDWHLFRQIKFPIMLIQRALNMVNYAVLFHRFFKKYRTGNTVLWVGSEQSAIRMWPYLRGKKPVIVNALEFYEREWYQSAMAKIAPQADIMTACEPHRAQYMMDWWGLEKLPYVLRNKPYGAIPPKGNGSTPELQAAIDRIRDKKVLLYQGGIFPERDLSLLADALRKGNSGYYLVLCGPLLKGGDLDALYRLYDKTVYLGYFPAPSHLEITPYATAAVTYYKDDCINTRYCAPNKIHEYAGCGVPMLCNRLPGLIETVGAAGAAECVDFGDADAVNAALDRIAAHFDDYRRAALAFYDSVDNTPTLQRIIEDAFSRTEAERV